MSSKSTSLAALLSLGLALATQANAATSTLYDNGPDTTVDALNISSGFQVSNSFNLAAASTLTSISFSSWLSQGDAPVSVDWAITNSAPSVGASTTPISLGTKSLLNLTGVSLPNSMGYDVYNASFTLNKTLGPGTYYLTLGNEITSRVSGTGDTIGGYIGESGAPLNTTTAFQYDPAGYYDADTNTSLPTTTSAHSSSFQITGVTPVPEPANFGLLAAGVGVLVLRFRRI